MGGFYPEEVQDEATAVRAQQEAILAQHKQFAEGLKEQQAEVELRKGDLMLGERMLTMFDPAVPKSARQFLYKELSGAVGVDPKGETSKNVGTMIMGLDPETMENLRRNFAAKLPNAKPGEITQLIKSALTGQADGISLLKLASAGPEEGGGAPPEPARVPVRSVTEAGGEQAAPGAARPATAPPGPAAAVGSGRRRLPTVGEIPPRFQEASPQLMQTLGIDPNQRLRNDDLIREGYTIPLDPKEQQKLATEIQEGSAATTGLAVKAARLHALFSGRPETLGIVGSTSQMIDSGIEQLRGGLRAIGVIDESDPESLKRIAALQMQRIDGSAEGKGVKRTAEDASRIASGMVDLAYSMATARGIPGNRLTNAIVAQHLGELGRSGSPEQFRATLKDTVERSTEQHSKMVQSKIGKAITPDLRTMTDDDLLTTYKNREIVPPAIQKAIEEEAKRRKGEPIKGTVVPKASPSLEEEEGLQQGDAARAERRAQMKEIRDQQTLELAELRELRAGRGEDRAEARAARQEKKDDQAYQLALRKEARIEEQQRRERIRVAFAELGKMIAASGARASVSAGSSGGGGDQDAGAFRLAQGSRQRGPPQPIDASRFQRRA